MYIDYLHIVLFVCVCVCVCMCEREREKGEVTGYLYGSPDHYYSLLYNMANE